MANYCTIDDVKGTAKGRLDIDISDYDYDLDMMIEGVSRAIDRHYGVVDNSFAASATATRYYDYDAGRIHGRTLVLDMPIISVSSIVNGDGTTLLANDYRLMPRNGRWYNEIKLRENSSAIAAWSFLTDGEIEVTGIWGFTATVPAEIREGCAYWCAWLHKNWQSGLQDSTANFELGSVSYTKAMPEPVKKFLPIYRMAFD